MNLRMRVATILMCVVLTALPVIANNVFVLPDGTIEQTIQVLTANPVANAGTYEGSQGSVGEIIASPDGSRYFTSFGTALESLVQTDGAFSVLSRSGEWNDAATDLALTPDGQYALVLAGVLRVYDATTGTEIATVAAGTSPISVAVSIDSSYALVLSSISQRLYRVDLTTFTVDTDLQITGTSTAVAAAPNGFFYVGSTNKVIVVDGETMEEVGRVNLSGVPEKLHFTPDGEVGVAANRNTNQDSLWAFDLDPNGGISIHSFVDPLGDQVRKITFDPRLAVVSNERVLATSTTARVIYDFSLPDLALDVLDPSGTSAPTDVSAIVKSGEMPEARYLFYTEDQMLRRVDLQNDSLTGAPPTLLFSAAGLRYAGPSSSAIPVSAILYNNNQVKAVGAAFRPLVIRALDTNGIPVYNVTVEVEGPEGVTITAMPRTNKDGLAEIRVDPGAVTGVIPVNVTLDGVLLQTFNIAVGSGSGVDPMGGIAIVSGQGQIVGDQNGLLFIDPLIVRVTGDDGEPLAGATVAWAIESGGGMVNATTTETNADGLTSVNFYPGYVAEVEGFASTTISATHLEQSVVFHITTVPSGLRLDGGLPTPPQVSLNDPPIAARDFVAMVGSVVEGAVKVTVTVLEGAYPGSAIPNVALKVYAGDDPTAEPYARCAGEAGVALTDADGVAICDLEVSGQVGGPVSLNVEVGGSNFLHFPGFSLTTTPGAPQTVTILQGNQQSGEPGETLATPLSAVVHDGAGNPLSDINVTWTVLQEGGVTLSNVQSTTDANGKVKATATLGNTPGTYQVQVSAGDASATFQLTVDVAISGLALVSGNNQSAVIGEAFDQPLIVQLTNDEGDGVPNQQIAFTVTSGSAALANATSTTDSQGKAQMQVTAGATAGAVTITAAYGGLTPVTFSLTVRVPGPAIDATSFSNGASGALGLVPGGVSVAIGAGIAPDVQDCTVAQSFGALPLELAGVSVEFGNGIYAPIFHVCNAGGVQSVAFQTPFELDAPGSVSVTISVDGGATTVDNVPVVAIQPGIFETTGNGLPYAVVLRPNGSVVSPQNPALRGETLSLFATGLGPVTPASGTNYLGVAGQTVNADFVIGVNNRGVRVLSAEYAVNSIGIYIVRFEVPQDAPSGSALPLALAARINGGLLFGNGSSLAVQ